MVKHGYPFRYTAITRLFIIILVLMLLLSGGCSLFDSTASLPAVTKLTAVSSVKDAVLCDLGNSLLLICRYGKDASGKPATSATIIDLKKDELIVQRTLNGILAPVSEYKDEERLYLTDDNARCVYIIDHQLQIVETKPLHNTDGIFSHDGQRYYYAESGAIVCRDLFTDAVTAAASKYDLRFHSVTGIHPTEELLTVRVYTDAYRNTTCPAVLDPISGDYYLLTDDIDTPMLFENEYLAAYTAYSEETPYLLYGKTKDDTKQVLIDAPEDINKCVWIPSSPYLLYSGKTLYSFSNTIKQYSLAEYGITSGLTKAVYLQEEGLIIGIDTGSGTLTLVNPQKLGSGTDVSIKTEDDFVQFNEYIPEDFTNSAYNLRVPASLTNCRRYADQLEDTYGVTVLLSNECVIPCAYSSFDISPTSSLGLYDREAEFIMSTLRQLESALTRYPAGFFDQFRNAAGDGGVRLLLTGTINIALSTVGYQYSSHEWYNIVLDVTSGSLEGTICHEIWHATEQRISLYDPDVFTDKAWSVYNPPDFKYNNGAKDYAKDTAYTAEEDGEGVYFARVYGKIAAAEDRASLMEVVMSPEFYDTDALMKSPQLTRKLQALCRAVRNTFNTSGWENVYWERYTE